MITKDDFTDKFMELLASFNRAMNKTYLDVWYKKCEKLNHESFCKTVDHLVMTSQHLPTMPQLLSVYRTLDNLTRGDSGKGCLYCVNGSVLYDRQVLGYGDTLLAYSVPCAFCRPSAGSYNAKINRRNYKLGFTPGEKVEEENERDLAMNKYRKLEEMAANVGQSIPSSQSEEEKRKARQQALFEEMNRSDQEEANEAINYPYKDSEYIPF